MRIIENSRELIEKASIFDRIKNKYTPFSLWEKQKEYLNLLNSKRFIVLLKTRQVAGTTLTCLIGLLRCALLDNYVVLVLSKTGDDAEEALLKAKECWESLPKVIRQILKIKKSNTSEIIFTNGSRFISLSANKGAGKTADMVIIDEAAHVNKKNSHIELYQVLRQVGPTLDKTNGQLVMVSSANGYNLFHGYYKRGKEKDNKYTSFFYSSNDDPTFTEDKRIDLIKQHGEDYVKENHPRNDTEAFIATGNCRFNVDDLREKLDRCIEPIWLGDLINLDDRVRFEHNSAGFLEVWEEAKKNVQYLISADTAEGIIAENDHHKDTDYNIAQVLKIDWQTKTLEQVAKYKSKVPPDIFEEELYNLGLYFNKAYIVVERNKDGTGILRGLSERKHYPNIYYDMVWNEKKQIKQKDLGLRITNANRYMIISKLDEFLRHGNILLNSIDSIDECLTFKRDENGKYRAQEGCHDDEVMSLANGVYCFEFIPRQEQIIENDMIGNIVSISNYKNYEDDYMYV